MSSSREQELDVQQHIHHQRVKKLLDEATFQQNVTSSDATKADYQKFKVKLEERFTRLESRAAIRDNAAEELVAVKETAEELRKR